MIWSIDPNWIIKQGVGAIRVSHVFVDGAEKSDKH